MILRASLRFALALLVAGAQLAGTAVATVPTTNPEASGYFCCCVGECACTGDCCNHAPEESDATDGPTVRIGAAGETIEAPKSCGAWRATLQRGPDQGKITIDTRGLRSEAPPPSSKRQTCEQSLRHSLDPGLHPSSPRAPPSSPVRL